MKENGNSIKKQRNYVLKSRKIDSSKHQNAVRYRERFTYQILMDVNNNRISILHSN